MNNNRYIITGGPGTGKSTLLNALSEEGFQCFEEISRVVIKEQHETGGDKVPWLNLAEFAETCYERMSLQLSECNTDNKCFYDRGLPDIIAYMRRGNLPVPKKYFTNSKNYNRIVFLAPAWKEIFVNDTERPESFDDSVEISQFLKKTYLELGFTVIELPNESVENRVKFILNYISTDKDSKTA